MSLSLDRRVLVPELSIRAYPDGQTRTAGLSRLYGTSRAALRMNEATTRLPCREPLDELERLLGDLPPAGVDRQRVPAVRDLFDLSHAGSERSPNRS